MFGLFLYLKESKTAMKNPINKLNKHYFILLFISLTTLIFLNVACKQRRMLNLLRYVEIDGKVIPISDIMDAGETKKKQVFYVIKPVLEDISSMSIGPIKSSEDGRMDVWALDIGENILRIALYKDEIEEDFYVRLKRLAFDAPYLTKLSINGKTIEGKNNIKEDNIIKVEVPLSMQTVPIEAKSDMEGAIISYEPELTNGVLKLNTFSDITEAKVIVEKFGHVREYKVLIKKIS